MSNRIRYLRERLGLSLERLAAMVGSDRSTIWRYESGRTPLMNDGAVRIASALGVARPEELLFDTSPPMATVIGYVGAGAEIVPIDDGDEEVEAPPGISGAPVVAFRVRGSSMTPAYREGDILFASNLSNVTNDVVGRDCVVQVKDGPRLVKRVHKGSKPGLFRLFSYENQDISDDVSITAATPVSWVRRT